MFYPSEDILLCCLELVDYDLSRSAMDVCTAALETDPLRPKYSRYARLGVSDFTWFVKDSLSPEGTRGRGADDRLRSMSLRELASRLLSYSFAHQNDGDIEWLRPVPGEVNSLRNQQFRVALSSPDSADASKLRRLVARCVFKDRFSHRHVVLPVIHVASASQALRNAAVAREADADGIFLINHAISSDHLIAIYQQVRAAHPEWWIGLNCLDLEPRVVFARIPGDVDGVWVDNAMIDETRIEQPAAEDVLEAQYRAGWLGLYFGGVAFKYQAVVEDLRRAVETAQQFMSVLTTSGAGTGMAADVNKIADMKYSSHFLPLAIASGVTPANVASYLSWSDCYLVATGISASFEELEPGLTRQLVQAVRTYDQKNWEREGDIAGASI